MRRAELGQAPQVQDRPGRHRGRGAGHHQSLNARETAPEHLVAYVRGQRSIENRHLKACTQQSGADLWGPGTCWSIRGLPGGRPCFNPVRICGVRGPQNSCVGDTGKFQSGADLWGPGTGIGLRQLTLAGVVSIRCGFMGSGDSMTGVHRDRRLVFQSGADLWGPGTLSRPHQPRSHDGFNPVRICGVRGLNRPTRPSLTRRFQSGADLWGPGTGSRAVRSGRARVSIRCGFVGSGDSTPVCGGAELGQRGALRQPLLGCGPVMRWSIMSGRWNCSSAHMSIFCANLRR